MGKKGSVRKVIPIEETIIDPLYEPLKLNRYELCEHLQRLKDVSHLGYGFSPYLLFDVAGMKEVVEVILENPKLEEELKNNCEEFLKLYDEIFEYFRKYLKWLLGKESEELYVFAGELKIYGGKNKCFKILRHKREEIFKKLNGDKEDKEGIKDRWREILKGFLYHPNEFKEENFDKIAHLFRLEYPVKVTCPICGEEQYMCEEGKIYSMKEALLRTFELRRARWLYLSGSLHTVHQASTHTRLSHEIGSLIVGVNALYEIDVYLYKDFSMLLGEYLLMRGELHEFLMANFLHDIGHPPLSHVLEPNPFIELDHEKITRNLILGEETEEGKIDWYVTMNYFLKVKTIKDFEYRFFKNRYDPLYDIPDKAVIENLTRHSLFEMDSGLRSELDRQDVSNELRKEFYKKGFTLSNPQMRQNSNERVITDAKKIYIIKEKNGIMNVYEQLRSESDIFLEYFGKNNELLESEIVTVSEVLDNFDIDKKRVFEILRGGEGEEKEKIYDTQFLNKLIDSDIDFDRIDHVKRDSEVCGLSLTSFRLIEILGSMSVVLPTSKAHKNIHKRDEESPYIFISEKGLKYVMDLLNSRRAIFNEVLYSDENNWINGVVNQIVMFMIKYLPHLRDMLPFITDETLSHFIVNDLFLGTQIEKLVHLFHGKQDYSAYGEPKRYKLKVDKEEGEEGVTNDMIKAIYRAVEKENGEYKKLQIPAVIFYTNIKEREKAENGDEKDDKKEGKWDDVLVYGKRFNSRSYYKFNDLLTEGDPYTVRLYENTKREVFPLKPIETETKNLLYIWVCNLVGTKKEKENLIEEIKNAIKNEALHGEEFTAWFVDLDIVEGT